MIYLSVTILTELDRKNEADCEYFVKGKVKQVNPKLEIWKMTNKTKEMFSKIFNHYEDINEKHKSDTLICGKKHLYLS